MKRAWQEFIRLLGDDPEVAGIGLLFGLFLVAVPVAVSIYLVRARHYAAAAGLALGVAVVVATVARDYRRGRLSFVSGALVAIWLLFLGLWATYEFWGPYLGR